MWPFSKKTTISQSGILRGATDHHSHILPGVDDGVESMDEALRILATYEAAGVKELWLTPHIMEDIPNTPEKLLARFAELQAAYTGSITLHLAAEYMIDNHLRSLLNELTEGNNTNNNCPSFKRGTSNTGNIAQEVQDNNNSPSSKREYPQGEGVEKDSNTDNNCPSFERGTSNARCIAEGVKDNYNSPSSKREYPQGKGVTLLPIGKKHNHLLVETSYFNPPMRLHETLRQIKSLGYHPLLAHPERYMYMDEEEYIRLHQEGVKFQLNLPSICGGYGNTVKKRALWLLKEGLYDVIGSDTHCEEGVEYLLGCRHSNTRLEVIENILQRTI